MGPVATAKNHQRGAPGKARRKRLRATVGLLRDRLIAPPDPRQTPSLDCGFLLYLFQRWLLQTTHSHRNGSSPL